jgi:hypothetical protein
MCLIIVSKDDIDTIKKNEPRIKEFPVSFVGNPKINGLPYKNAHMISGSSNILDLLKNNFGNIKSFKKNKLSGSSMDINYLNDNEGNVSSLTNIRKNRNNCFGKSCHVMDRPFGPQDNQYILQGYQPSCAIPIRSNLPIKEKLVNNNNNNNFGMTTPGTVHWQSERKIWPTPKILVNGNNYQQDMSGNKYTKANVPMTYKNDYINTNYYDPLKIYNMTNAEIAKYNPSKMKFGNKSKKFISGPVNQTYPFLTYAAGSNGVSRVTGNNYFPEQVPIQSSPKTAYLSRNIKDYVTKNADTQQMLYQGLNSPWSINAQGINNYGTKLKKSNRLIPSKSLNYPNYKPKPEKPYGNKNPWILTRTPGGNDRTPSQFFKRQRFTENGNSFGKKEKKIKEPSKKTMKFTSPLGVEISFK